MSAVGGLAGCIGGLTGGNDSGDGGDSSGGGGDGTTGSATCTDVTNGYDTEDVGERPLFVDFDYPALFDQLEYDTTPTQVIVGSEKAPPGEAFLEFNLQQSTDTESEPAELLDWEEASQNGFSTVTSFNGEEVEFGGDADPRTGTVFLNANLPYEVDGERRLFRTKITLRAQEESDECTEALREAIEHVVESLALNEETTLG